MFLNLNLGKKLRFKTIRIKSILSATYLTEKHKNPWFN